MKLKISLKDMIGKGYKKFWNFKGRYRICKGGRGSKKSATMALWLIYNIMKYPLANALVVRQVFNTLKDSCWAQLQWAVRKLGVAHLWKFSKSPLEITYLPTNQKILFRGMDDPMSLTSLTVETGYLCWVWIEEAYQLKSEDAFNKLDMSIRGKLPDGYFKQITLTFNPWSANHWLKSRFFDVEDENILALTTNYLINEFLGDDDIEIFKKMMEQNPRRYDCEGLGNWGVVSGLVYTNWIQENFDEREIEKRDGVREIFGLDFGFVHDPTAMLRALVDEDKKEIYICDEIIYKKGLTNDEIYKIIDKSGYKGRRIIADCAEQKSIEEIRRMGVYEIVGCKKGPDSKRHGIQLLQQYKIIIHPSCINFLTEIEMYCWEQNRLGQETGKPEDGNDHLLDALLYAIQTKANVVKKSNGDIRKKLGLR